MPLTPITQLSGTLRLTHGSNLAHTTADLTAEIFRNDVIILVAPTAHAVGGDPTAAETGAGPATGPGSSPAAAFAQPLSFRVSSAFGDPPPLVSAWAMAATPVAASAAADDDDDDDDDEGDEDEDAADANDDAGAEEDEDAKLAAGDADGAADDGPKPRKRRGRGSGGGGSKRSTAMTAAGIAAVSVANGTVSTGGHFTAADTAPHVLRRTAADYTYPFGPDVLPLDRPWPGRSCSGVFAFKFGATGDIRVLWREVVSHSTLRSIAGAAVHTGAVAVGGGGSDAEDSGGSAVAKSDPRSHAPPALFVTLAGASARAPGGGDAGVRRVGALAAAAAAAAARGRPGAAARGGSAAAAAASASAASSISASSTTFPADHRALRIEMAKFGLDRAAPMADGTLTTGLFGPRPAQAGAQRGRGGAAQRGPRRPTSRSFVVASNAHVAGTEIELAVKRARLEILKEQWAAAKSGASGHGR